MKTEIVHWHILVVCIDDDAWFVEAVKVIRTSESYLEEQPFEEKLDGWIEKHLAAKAASRDGLC
ncbi:hypothetical protein KGQ27_01180 [Patescibacteria group bacterium]|nr:hypothetical protein [Patescibacteria group bacterium]MDE1946544.1 hypothetical protein [Patescibacteria group bacterium]MDE2010895.1 hypothetical protein [Patescibacteria group bacterium]MDE2232779.1 hypothetical protein [Patescibacteria group bacterium]